MTDVVQRLWGFCHTLRHDGIDYGDYIEQITYLLFLKMADEREIDLSALRYEDEREDGRRVQRKKNCSWPALRERSGIPLTDHYAETLRILGKQPGILGDIYAGAQSRFKSGQSEEARLPDR
jgi:type I restriction enzyme M protein